MIKLIPMLVICVAAILLPGCDEETIPTDAPPVFAVEPVDVPQFLDFSRPREYTFAFRVTHPRGGGVVSDVILRFIAGDQNTVLKEIRLYDDGGAQIASNDVIAGDGVYTSRDSTGTDTMGNPLLPLGVLYLKATASDLQGESRESGLVETLALLNAAPVLVSATAPDTVALGAENLLFQATIQDSNAVEDIAAVDLLFLRNGLPAFQSTLSVTQIISGDSATYAAVFDSTLAIGLLGTYDLQITARDQSEETSNPFEQPILVENAPPQIFNLQMVDSLQLPGAGEVNTTLITIDVNDRQTPADIDSVYFNSILPGGNPSASNPFVMYDNGLPYNPGGVPEEAGDAVAEDGTYSLTIGLPQGVPTGAYTFTFFVRDKAGQLTQGPTDSLIVYQ